MTVVDATVNVAMKLHIHDNYVYMGSLRGDS